MGWTAGEADRADASGAHVCGVQDAEEAGHCSGHPQADRCPADQQRAVKHIGCSDPTV